MIRTDYMFTSIYEVLSQLLIKPCSSFLSICKGGYNSCFNEHYYICIVLALEICHGEAVSLLIMVLLFYETLVLIVGSKLGKKIRSGGYTIKEKTMEDGGGITDNTD